MAASYQARSGRKLPALQNAVRELNGPTAGADQVSENEGSVGRIAGVTCSHGFEAPGRHSATQAAQARHSGTPAITLAQSVRMALRMVAPTHAVP
jgi:hypothetical protein